MNREKGMNMKYAETIGIIGGMGSYATLDFFKRILDAFPAEKECDRPRVLVDNRCTMPSRVRAILYQEKTEDVISELTDAVRGLLECGADHLIFACNTSHAFLRDVFQIVPEAEQKTVHIINTLARRFQENGIQSAYLIGSEGTLQSNIYQESFGRYGITLDVPAPGDWVKLREFIETVKQGHVTARERERFRKFCAGLPNDNIILGCTELPVLVPAGKMDQGKMMWDPLASAIDDIKSIIK